MLPAGSDVVAAYRGSLLAAARKGTLFIDCSTIDVGAAKLAHALADAAGMPALDAPVSGGVSGAAAATLTFMVGGDAGAVESARPLLAVMGRRLVHCGGPGLGQAAKICNNMILGVSMIAVSEAFVLAERLGLAHQALFDVAANSSGQCWALTTYCPVPGPVPASPANHGYRPGFAAALMLKDLSLGQDQAAALGADTALGRHARDIYRAFVENGAAARDFSAIVEAVREKGPIAPAALPSLPIAYFPCPAAAWTCRLPWTISSSTCCSLVCSTWRSPTFSPRFSTITRSPTAKMSLQPVRDDDLGNAVALELEHRLEQPLGRHDRQIGGRLVEDHHPRLEEMARAIATDCWRPPDRLSTR